MIAWCLKTQQWWNCAEIFVQIIDLKGCSWLRIYPILYYVLPSHNKLAMIELYMIIKMACVWRIANWNALNILRRPTGIFKRLSVNRETFFASSRGRFYSEIHIHARAHTRTHYPRFKSFLCIRWDKRFGTFSKTSNCHLKTLAI